VKPSVLFFLAAGLPLLLLGAEGLVRGSSALARRMGVSPLVVGLTVVAFATSAPELFVSVSAALQDKGSIAVTNVVGSNIANVLLILGLAGLIRPLRVKAEVIRVDLPIMVVVSLLGLALLVDGRIDRWEGALLLFGIVVYTGLTIWLARHESLASVRSEFERGVPTRPRGVPGQLALVLAGLSTLILGSHFLVKGAVGLAGYLGVPEAVIGLTVVAVGTSLPELVTSAVAAIRDESDIAIGNVIGSNIFNLLAILGVSALVRPLRSTGVVGLDLVIMIAAAVVVLPMARTGLRLNRWEAAAMLVAYAAYLYLR
jgi:cation:H+ antiporter